MIEELQRLADASGMTRSTYVRHILTEAIEKDRTYKTVAEDRGRYGADD